MMGLLDQRTAAGSIAGLGDAALVAFLTAGTLAGGEAEVRHQLGGGIEASQISRLGHQGHGIDEGDSAQAHQGADDRGAFPIGQGGLHCFGQALEAFGGDGDGFQVFLEGDLLGGMAQFDGGEITQMGLRPIALARVTTAQAEQKPFETLAGPAPIDHRSVLAAPPDKKEKPVLLFTNRKK